MDTEAMDMVVTTMARDPLMPNLKLMPDICMVDTDMEDMEDMVMVLMGVDTDIAALDTTEDMVDTDMEDMEDMVMVLMVVDTDIAALDTTEEMVMVLDTEVMAVSGDKHSQVLLPIFLLELSTRNCQLLITCLRTSHPLIRNQYLKFVESRI